MKKYLFALVCLFAFGFTQAQNVPNGGFENWTSGEPDSWYTNNYLTSIPVTQTSPGHSGTYAAKGEVVSTGSGVLAPVLASTDASGNGFAVTQAYTTLNFWYKTSLTGANTLLVLVSMKDAGGNTVSANSTNFAGTVSTFTLATVPIVYFGPNPVECTIQFMILDTTSVPATAGNYFIVDDVNLSGLTTAVQENTSSINITNVYPNPASHSASIQYYLPSKSKVQLQVLNAQGKTVREMLLPEADAGNHEADFDIATFPAGIYLVRMKTNQGVSFAHLQVSR